MHFLPVSEFVQAVSSVFLNLEANVFRSFMTALDLFLNLGWAPSAGSIQHLEVLCVQAYDR